MSKANLEKEELMQFGRAWDKAIESNDTDAIGKYMADDWVIIGSDGITTKEKFLELVRSGILSHNKMDFEDIRAEIYGDTGIVTSKGTSAGTYDCHPFSIYEWTTSVYVRTKGKWTCVLTMLATTNEQQNS